MVIFYCLVESFTQQRDIYQALNTFTTLMNVDRSNCFIYQQLFSVLRYTPYMNNFLQNNSSLLC